MGLLHSFKRVIAVWCLCLLCLSSCGSGKKEGGYRIGIDPSWYPLSLMGMETNVLAFSQELLQEIAKFEKLKLTRIDTNWDNLVWGLEEKKYEGILSSMQPYVFTEKKYDYSDLYLKTGPVLVVPVQSQMTSLEMMNGKEVAILEGSSSVLIAEKNPTILIRAYESIPEALNDIVAGVIEGALIPALPAAAYCRNLYPNELKVATAPLDEEGLRLITLHQEDNILITAFNEALKKLHADGRYDALRQKWDLPSN